MKLLSVLACAVLTAAATAAPLDRSDAGSYTILNIHHEPTDIQMRFFLSGQQWLMDGRKEYENWQPVCRGDGYCRLSVSDTHQIQSWKNRLSPDWRKHTFHCINNNAFAFCRTRHPYQKHRRAYWFFALKDQEIHPLPLKRDLVLSHKLHHPSQATRLPKIKLKN